MAFGFNNCKVDKVESQTPGIIRDYSKMTQARPSPNTRSTPIINPSPNPEINQSLIEAVKEGNINKVREALNNGADVDYQTEEGKTALMWASLRTFKPSLTSMALTKANACLPGPGPCNDMAWPIRENEQNVEILNIVELLLDAGADVNLQDNYGRTALMEPSGLGYIETVRLLLEAGADVNLQDNYGWTALYHASRTGRTEIVRLLRAAGATE